MKEASTMTMRIHRAVRTLSLLLALSMLLFRQRHFLRGRNARPFRTHRFGFYARFG